MARHLMKKLYFFCSNFCSHTYINILNIVFSCLRISEKRIYVSSFFGKYCDSPKAIALSLAEANKNLQIVYQVNKNYDSFPKELVCSAKGSIKDLYYRSTARIIIDNYYGGHEVFLRDNSDQSRSIFEKRRRNIGKRKQIVLSTWHGTPLKKMGIDSEDSNIIDFDCPNTFFALGNQYTAKVMQHITFGKIPIFITGTPRNDVLVNVSLDHKQDLKKRMGIDSSKKLLLYAPTFRESSGEGSEIDIENSGINQVNEIDFENLAESLTSKFGGEWVFVLRFHHYVEKMIDWGTIRKQNNVDIINGNKFEDMADYLQIADVLVTDASSCFFDFALTRRPCFLFFPDVDRYRKERGLYIDFTEMPFPLSKDYAELVSSINSFVETEYIKECDTFLKIIGNADDGKATERIIKMINEPVNLWSTEEGWQYQTNNRM